MSASSNQDSDWNYRKIDQRLIVIKTKNENVRKAAATDVLTNLPFAINVPEKVPMEKLQPEKEYLAQLKVYTSNNLEGIDEEFFNFFEAVDIDQDLEEFHKGILGLPQQNTL